MLAQPSSRPFTVAVFGATGHTARFVLDELTRRGLRTLALARDPTRLASVAADERRTATIDDPAALAAALEGAHCVLNCAGPFGETAPALITASRARGLPYLDVTGEALVALDLFARWGELPPTEHWVGAPAFGFFGALGSMLAAVAAGDWPRVDTVRVRVALDGWRPTRGSRLAGARRAGRTVVWESGQLWVRPPGAPERSSWAFGAPFGDQAVQRFTSVDVVTISRALPCRAIEAFINEAPLRDLADPQTGGPVAADERGRSAQRFRMEVTVEAAGRQRTASAAGRDIYAVTGPLVAEACARVLRGEALRGGLVSPAQLFPSREFLLSLSPEPFELELP